MQTNYDYDQQIGFEGMLADITFAKDYESGYAEGEIHIGKVVTMGTANGQVKHPVVATDITDIKKIRGVCFHSHDQEKKSNANYSYLDKSVVNVARKGRVWIKVVTPVVEGTSDVNVYYAGAVQKGSIGGTAVAGETAVMPKARWKTSAVAGGLAMLEIDL